MQQLEPTYLRYVYDGLSKGSISSNNPTSLPIGFIGLFEDEFPSSMPLVERMSILNRLAIWALLKGPVSIEMVAEVLNEHPDNTKALIDTYSKWFNSPEPGKYILYHDRLRTYLLQKLSDHEVQDLNETLISYLENSLNIEGLNEAELYALEHLSTHMAIESQMGNNYERLHEFVNQEDLWKKQITTSKEYKWSQNSLEISVQLAALKNDSKNIKRSVRNRLKIQKDEEKNYHIVLNLIEKNEFDLALKRAFNWESSPQIKLLIVILYETLFGKYKSKQIENIFFIEIVSNLKFLLIDNNVKEKIKIEKDQTNKQKKYKIYWTDFFPQVAMYSIHLQMVKKEIDFNFIWTPVKSIDYIKLFDHDYSEIISKDESLIPIINILYNESSLEILFKNFLYLASYCIKNNYLNSFEEYMNTLNKIVDHYESSSSAYFEKLIKINNEIFNHNGQVPFDTSNFKNQVISKIFEKLDEINDFHSKKDIFKLINLRLETDKKTTEIFRNKILDLFHKTKFSKNYKIEGTYDLASMLSPKQAFELIKEIDVFDYSFLVSLLNSSIENSLQLKILRKIIESLKSEVSYNVNQGRGYDEPEPRGKVLIGLAKYYIRIGDLSNALNYLNQIDVTEELYLTDDFYNVYVSIAKKLIKKDDIIFDVVKLKSLFQSQGQVVNYKLSENEIKSMVLPEKSKESNDNDCFLSVEEINNGIQKFINDILDGDGQFIFGNKGGFIATLINNSHHELVFDLIRLLPLEKDYWRNNYFVDLGCLLIEQNRTDSVRILLKKIDSEIFHFKLLICLISKSYKDNNIEEFVDLIKQINNPLLKIYLFLIFREYFNVKSEMLNKEIEIARNSLNYTETLSGVFEICNNKDNLKDLIFDESIKKTKNIIVIKDVEEEEMKDEFFSNFYEMEALNCVDIGIQLLHYYNLNEDEINYNKILSSLITKIGLENSIDDAISDSFNNIICLYNEKSDYLNESKVHCENITNYISLKRIKVNTVLLYNLVSNYSSITYEKFVIEYKLIVDEIWKEDTLDKITEFIENQFLNNKTIDFLQFLVKINCNNDFRKRLISKILILDTIPRFEIDQLEELILVCPEVFQFVIDYAFNKKLYLGDLLLKEFNPNKHSDSSEILKDFLGNHISHLLNFDSILKCIQDNGLYENNRRNMSILAINLSHLGLFEEAIIISELIKEDEFVYYKHNGYPNGDVNVENSMKSIVLKTIAKDQLKHGFVDLSIKTANKINDLNIRFLLYNELRDILSKNIGDFDFAFEIEIFKLYDHQSRISKWSSVYSEVIEDAFSTDILNIFNSLAQEFKRDLSNSKDKLLITERISKFLDKFLKITFKNLNSDFIIFVIEFLQDKKLLKDQAKFLVTYLVKILTKTEDYIDQIIRDNNEYNSDILYCGYILSNLCKSLTDDKFKSIKKRFLYKLIKIVDNPVIMEADDIRWDSFHQYEPYNAKLREQGIWLDYATLSFDVFLISKNIDTAKSILYYEKCIEYVSNSEKQFFKNNQIHDLSEAYRSLRFYCELLDVRYHHTAKSNLVYLKLLKYFSKINDLNEFDKVLSLFLSPNLLNPLNKDFRFENLNTYLNNYKSITNKIRAKENYINLKSISTKERLENSNGEVLKFETHKIEEDGLVCEKIFGKSIFSSNNDIDIKTEKVYGHLNLQCSVIDIKSFTIETISNLIEIPIDIVIKIINYELFIVINSANSFNSKGQKLNFKDVISEQEYYDICHSFNAKNKTISKNESERFIANYGPKAIRDIFLKSFGQDFSYNYHNQNLSLFQFLDLLITDCIPVIHPDFRGPIFFKEDKPYSEINELYKKLIIRNDRLIRLKEISAPEVIIRNEKRMVQQAYNSLQNHFYDKIDGDNSNELESLINFYFYLLIELNEFSEIFTQKLHYLKELLSKFHNKNKLSMYRIKICDILLSLFKNYLFKNDSVICNKIIQEVNAFQKVFSDEELHKLALIKFKYLSNEDAFIFYNKNSSRFNKYIFSEDINNLLMKGEIDIDYPEIFLYHFNNNVDVLKDYENSLQKKAIELSI